MKHYLAIDIGGTYIKSAIFDEQQNMYDHDQVKTKENIDNAIVGQLKHIIDRTSANEVINGIGISTAGIVDREGGKIVYAGPTIPNYAGTNLKQELSDVYGLPVCVENDVNATLLGEIWKGAGRGQNHIFCLTLGTGIGGAYYEDGIMDGVHAQANAIGYLLYEEATQTNYEMRASTSALNTLIQQQYGVDTDAEEVFHLAKTGDSRSNKVIKTWTKEIAKGLAQIILIKDPSCIIIGGGVSAQGRHLLDPIEYNLKQFLPPSFLKTETKAAKLANHAALYGAIYPFFEREEF